MQCTVVPSPVMMLELFHVLLTTLSRYIIILCYCEQYLSLSYLQLFQADVTDVGLIWCWKDLII